MTTPTPSPDVREMGARAMYELGAIVGGGIPWEDQDDGVRRVYLRRTDAVLAAVSPVIRQQVAEEVAADFEARCIAYWPEDPDWPGMAENARRSSWHVGAAAIARTHAHPEEGK